MTRPTVPLQRGHYRPREPDHLRLAPEPRAFLAELFRRLGQTLRPGALPGVEARERFLEAHLGVPTAGQAVVTQEYPRAASNHVLVAVADVLAAPPYRTETAVDYDDDEGQRAPRYRAVPITPDATRDVLEEGYYPSRVGDTPLVVGVCQRRELHVWVHVRADDRDLAREVLRRVEDCPKLYRGQVITLGAKGYPSFVTVPPTRFDTDVVLEPDVRQEIERHVLRFAAREAAYRAAGLPFRRGVILAGPPGVGKTQVFRALTHELAGRYTVLWLTPRSVSQEEDLAGVFAFARALAPTLLLWEDLDLVVRDRSDAGTAGMLGELLAQLDGAASAEGILTCASTNDATALDTALSARPSRFDRILRLGAPGREARLRLLRQFSARIEPLTADLDLVAQRTEGLTGACLQELVVAAYTRALDAAEKADVATPVPVTTAHFLDALASLASARRTRIGWQVPRVPSTHHQPGADRIVAADA